MGRGWNICMVLMIGTLIRRLDAVDTLGSYNIDKNAISVSGLSSGGFMAGQLHVAYSDTFMGVGVVAGGPFYCAKNSLATALTPCMTSPGMINVNSLVTNANTQASAGKISDVSSLYDSKVYLFSGTADTTVDQGVVEKTKTFYDEFVQPSNIVKEFNINAQHGFPTMNYGGACNRQNSEYINDCGYDGAYHILDHIYGSGLETPDYSLTAPAPAGTVTTFDQTEFVSAFNSASVGMNSYGYIFVPDSCADGTKVCRLHVSLHGCKQGVEYIGDTYVQHTGYNEVAALNDIIVIYPQAVKIPIDNGNGCWDWWGYTDGEYAYNDGVQMEAIKAMVDRVASGGSGNPDPQPTVAGTTTTLAAGSTTTKGSSSGGGNGVLGSYNADKNAVSTSGLSSGADMAIQMHVAESDTIMGAGAIAGGPYYCAMDNVGIATTYCMYMPYMISVNLLISAAENHAASGTVDELANLADDNVYLLSGTEDTVVVQGVVEKTQEFYKNYIPGESNIKAEYDLAAQNGFPTMNKGGACDRINSNGINNCGFAAAYQILNHIYGGDLQMPDYYSTAPLNGQLLEFSQAEFTGSTDPTDIGLSETGSVFVPDNCASGSVACKVHVAFHGCKQGDDSVAEAFATDAGYNEVAAMNDIIILYPRSAMILLTNPQDCWDWWGYTDGEYAFNDGQQITAIMNMIDRIVS